MSALIFCARKLQAESARVEGAATGLALKSALDQGWPRLSDNLLATAGVKGLYRTMFRVALFASGLWRVQVIT